MDLTNYAVASGLLTFFVIGATELVKQIFARNWKSVVIIIVSALVGALAGLELSVIGWVVGLALGLASSGIITTAQKFGEGTSSLPPTA